MKTLMILLIIALLIPTVAATVCPSNNQIDFSIIPCEGVTPIISRDCINFTALIVLLNDTSVNDTVNLTNMFDDIYNFSFNFSDKGTYQITLCDNSTAIVMVDTFLEFYTEQTYVYLFSIFAAFVMLGGGLYYDKKFLVMFSGIAFTITGMIMLINGVAEISNVLLLNTISYAMMGAGFYFMATSYLNFEEMMDFSGSKQ